MREPIYDNIGLREVDVTKNIRRETTASTELIESVRKRGVTKPVLVRLAPAGSAYVYEMMDGHRRWHAAKAAGHETIPARIFDLTDREYREIQLECTGLHQDLDPLDRARALKCLIDEHGLTQAEAGALVEGGKSQSWVSKQLGLLDLPEAAQCLIHRGMLSASAAEEVSRLKGRPELVASLVESLQEPDSPLTVEQVRNAVSDTVSRGGKPLDKLAHADCKKGCDRKTTAHNADYCLDPECWEAKREAYRRTLLAAAAAGGNPLVGYGVASDAHPGCPGDCLQSGMVLRYAGGLPMRACFAPSSECHQERFRETQTRQNERRAASQKARDAEYAALKAKEEAREAAEEQRLDRVAAYLRQRDADAPEGLTGPEARLACVAVLSGYAALDYVRAVLDWGDLDDDQTRDAVALMSARSLANLTVGYLLAERPDVLELGDVGEAYREEVLRRDETPEVDAVDLDHEPELDPERLARPGMERDQGDADAQEGGPPTPGPSGDDPVDETLGSADAEPEAEPELAPLPLAKASYGPNPAVTDCPHYANSRSPEACLDCCGSVRAEEGECCGHVTSGQAPFRCPGGLDVCPVAVGGEETEAPPITVCPVERTTRTAEHCLTCCRGNKAQDGCCESVTSSQAPFSCDGTDCPEDGGDEEEDDYRA